MIFFSTFLSVCRDRGLVLIVLLLPLVSLGQSQNLILHDESQTHDTLVDTVVEMTGRSELHIRGAGDPVPASQIHLNSSGSWLFFDNIIPSVVNSTLLGRVRVNRAAASLNQNVRVVEYGAGTVVIPHGPNFAPLTVYSESGFRGESMPMRTHDYYNTPSALGAMQGNISSFTLKRGYMATVAQEADGGGISKIYVAQDGDIEVDALPAELDDAIGFVRVFPWRWVSQKGFAGGSAFERSLVNATWWYDWDNQTHSILDREYVPMRHNAGWNSYSNINNKQNSTHALGFNEPDRPDQADMTVEQALDQWPELMASGLRLGSPSPSDAGPALDWLYEFIDEADARDYRVDFVAVHYYKNNWSAGQMYNWLRGIHERTGRPIWITEWNNGCNWTTPHPTYESNATRVAEYLDMLASAPFIERYSFYQWCTNRELVVDGNLTPAGEVYRDFQAPSAYHQELPAGVGPDARFAFDGHARDGTGSGNNGMVVGFPDFVEGPSGDAIQLDGQNGYVQLPPSVGRSSEFTFAGWIKWDGGSANQRVFELGNNATDRYVYLTPRSDGNTLRFAIRNGAAGEQQINAPALTPGVWTHVAVTTDGGTGRLYVNGRLTATNSGMTIQPGQVDAFRNYIGRNFHHAPRFAGALDDVHFLGHALDGRQVSRLPGAASEEPDFAPVVAPEAQVLQLYGRNLSAMTDLDGVGFSGWKTTKLEGPSWLTVSPNGHLTGVPGLSDIGRNRVTIRAVDASGIVSIRRVELIVSHPLGIVARYPFEGSARSDVGEAGAVTEGSPGYVAGVRGESAISLNGFSQHVQLPAGVADSAEITIASWVLWTAGGSNWQRVFDFGNSTSEYLFLTPRSGASGNRLRFGIRAGGPEQILEGPAALTTNRWVHVAVTLGEGIGTLYLNGTEVDSGAISLTPADIRPRFNYIGKSQWPDPLFGGRIDDFVIFNHALTASEVSDLADRLPPNFVDDPIVLPDAVLGEPYAGSIAGSASDPSGNAVTYGKVRGPAWLHVAADGTLSGTPGEWNDGTNRFVVRAKNGGVAGKDAKLLIRVPSPPELIAHYEFLGNALDSSGSFDADAGAATSYVASQFDQALQLNGGGEHVILPAEVANLDRITIVARVRWNGGGIWQRIFDFGNSTSEYMYLSPRSGAETLRFGITTGRNATQQVLESAPLPTGEWVHVAVSLGDGIGRLYVDGALVDIRSMSVTPDAFDPVNNYIGKSQWASDPFFDGLVDDFRIYSRILSDTEIQQVALSHFGSMILGEPETVSFDEWAADIAFPPGLEGTRADADHDGVPNVLEYLFATDPLVADRVGLPVGRLISGSELGESADPEKTYLGIQTAVRRDRSGVTLVAQAASDLAGLSQPEAMENAILAGPPAADGDYDIFTYYYARPLEDSTEGGGFIRLQAEVMGEL